MPKRTIFLVMSLSALLILGARCGRSTNNSNTANQPTKRSVRGLSYSPSETTTKGIKDFFSRANEAGSFVSWAGPSSDLAAERPGRTLVTQIREHGLTPVAIVSPTTDEIASDDSLKKWSEQIVTYARDIKPEYFCIGNEINKSFSASELDRFLKKIPENVRSIHDASPTTKVCATIQYEWMKGLHGGLFGEKNDPELSQWNILPRLSSLDILAISSYPGLIYHNPADVPTNYYTRITQETKIPIAISELGWTHSGDGEWSSDRNEQAAFIQRFTNITATLSPSFTIWSFLFDPEAKAPFNAMGLIEKNGKTNEAWEAWKK